jgi:SnoaL-like protein
VPRSTVARIALALLLGAAAVYAFQRLFPSEEQRIRRQLEAIAEDANSLTPDLSGAATAARLAMYFTEDVTIDPGAGIEPLRGRDTILAVARTVQSRGEARVDIKDPNVTLAPDRPSAAVALMVTLTRDPGTSKETLEAHEFALTMVKRDSAWLISHVTAVERLR